MRRSSKEPAEGEIPGASRLEELGPQQEQQQHHQQQQQQQQQHQQQQNETNDKKGRESSTPATSTRRPSIQKPVENEQEKSQEFATRARAPARQPRPLRPNLRRQVIVRGETSTSVPVIGGRPIELTSVLPAGAISMTSGPPKRPTHLPARYVLPASQGAARMVPVPAASKPNRYAAWAQVQHWQAAVAQAQAQAQQQIGPLEQAVNPRQQGFQHHFSSAASRVLVVNPMHIVNISKHTKSRLIKSIEAIKRFSEKWFSHVLLLLFLAVYACFGAYVFISFEAPTENWEKQFIIDTRLKIVNESWTEAIEGTGGREPFIESLRVKLEDYERLLNRACASGMGSHSLENQWTFWNALFFSMTVFTTIGYGHLTPITFAGRVATMVYAIFGIPILLMVLADLGKLLTRIIKYAFKKFRYLYNKLFKKNKTSQRTRKLISDNTNQYIGFARRGLQRGVANYIQPNYQRIPRAATLLREKLWFPSKHSSSAEPNRPDMNVSSSPEASPPEKPRDAICQLDGDGSIGKKISVSSEVIITPNKQTKPVSPQPGERRGEHPLGAHHHHQHQQQQQHQHQHHGHAHNQHLAGSDSVRRDRTSNKRKTSLVGPGKLSHHKNPKSSLSRSSSSSLLTGGAQCIAEDRAKSAVPLTSGEDPFAPVVGSPGEPPTSGDGTFDADEIEGLSQEGVMEEEDEEEEEEDFDIPVSFAVFLLIVYMMFGAVVFSIWEGWNFFDSLYFVFISMSTIGFGDLVPQHPKRMIGTFIYLLFGLALTSMCINVVQEKIHATFLRAKMQIGEKMGFDLDQIMADDYYGSMDTNGCLDDDCESHSVAISQTNSLTTQHNNDKQHEFAISSEAPVVAGSKLDGSQSADQTDGVRPSKSKESVKMKKRSVPASLPGHTAQTPASSSSAAASFRRKSSNKRREPISRQATQTSGVGVVPIIPAGLVKLPGEPLQRPIKSQLEVVRAGEQFVVLLNEPVPPINPTTATAAPVLAPATTPNTTTDKPVNINVGGLCEPLGPTGNRQARQIVKSRSSESPLMMASAPYRCDSSTSAASFRSSNLVASKGSSAGGGRRSAGSSRRSSVSQELNQLDDLIMVLAGQAKQETRFGPLLGISRSNSRH